MDCSVVVMLMEVYSSVAVLAATSDATLARVGCVELCCMHVTVCLM